VTARKLNNSRAVIGSFRMSEQLIDQARRGLHGTAGHNQRPALLKIDFLGKNVYNI